MGITVLKNNVPWGPFSRAQIDEGLERGDFTLQSLAHAPGMKGWLPLEEVIHILEPKLPPVPITRDLPPVPSPEALAKALPPLLPVPPRGNTVLLTPPVPQAEKEAPVLLPPAPFIPRCFAFLVDCIILFVPFVVIMGLSALALEIQGWWERNDPESMNQEWALLKRNFDQLFLLVAVGLGWIYGAGLECSRWQATLGKQWVGIKVTDIRGERLSFLQATGRHAGKYLSALTCLLGFLMALFTKRNQALHDLIAGTLVVRK